ncbi:MAG: hypothetical protein HZR80_04160 [Candidatus Heimdallarchaeota archaeon]
MTEITTKTRSLRDAFTKPANFSKKGKEKRIAFPIAEWIRINGRKLFLTRKFFEVTKEDKLPCFKCSKITTGFLGIVQLDRKGGQNLYAFQGDHCCSEMIIYTVEK